MNKYIVSKHYCNYLYSMYNNKNQRNVLLTTINNGRIKFKISLCALFTALGALTRI